MRPYYEIIADKRDGKKLSGEDIAAFLDAYSFGKLPDYQMAAMLMAVMIRSLDDEELAVWTDKVIRSGTVLDFSGIPGMKIDKHSTGGVGDKISIPLAPVLAAMGFRVPMISGRGLGHTGGTLDKLEAIPGFSVNLTLDQFEECIRKVGFSMIGQTPEIAPLDKSLYALRDVTATVPSIPLISASIMGKKMAEGIDGLLLDVKVGNGAFMRTFEDAKTLAKTMKAIGERLGKKVVVLFTNMNEPLGYAVGNALEIVESIEVLKGVDIPQVRELTLEMAGRLAALFGVSKDLESGRALAAQKIASGEAMAKFREMTAFQGGDASVCDDYSKLPRAKSRLDVLAESEGYITDIDALAFGKACVVLGGGRQTKDDIVDPAVGYVFAKKVGDAVAKGDTLYTIHYNDAAKFEASNAYLKDAVKIGGTKPAPSKLIIETM